MRPSLLETANALRTVDARFPWVGPTPDEAEVADVLTEIHELHQGAADEPDARGQYGRCTGCREMWPCAAWLYGEQLAVQWLGRAAQRVYEDAKTRLDKPSDRRTA